MKWNSAGGVRKGFSQRALQKSSAAQTASQPSTMSVVSDTTLSSTRIMDIPLGKSYELSPSQFKHLDVAARRGGMLFMVPSPRFVDDPKQARDNKRLCDEFDDLLALGFVVDISSNYEDNVKEAWEEQGRHVRFMALSDFGMLMFMPDDTERKPN